MRAYIRITSTTSGSVITGYHAYTESYTHYYPFGMAMPGRSYNSGEYRFGFNGKEKIDEITEVSGADYDFGDRIYNTRLGRWLSVDPMQSKYQGWSPYNFSMCNPVFFNDPDGKTPRVTVTKDASGNTTIKLQFNILVTDKTKEQAGAAHIKANEQAIREYFPTHTFLNEDGTTTTVSFELNFEYTTSDKVYNAFYKKNRGAALSLDYDEDLVFSDGQPDANYEGGGIAFGPNIAPGKIAHEIGHDIGFGDQYLQDKSNPEGYALVIKEYLNTMMGSADKLSEKEAKKIANAVKEKNITNAVVQPVDTNSDLPQNGSTVEVYKDKAGKDGPHKATVLPGKFGSTKTKQGQIITQ